MRALVPGFLLLASCAGTAEDADGAERAAGALAAVPTSPESQRAAIVATAKKGAAGKRPGGHCYAAVARYIDTVGYGKMPAQPKGRIGTLPEIPPAFTPFAHDFADYANAASHLADLGLTRIPLDNPYDAPAGALVVVRAGAPGTSHPTAGDISIAAGDGHFYNDGDMSYGSAKSFPPGNDFVLGIYVPAGDEGSP